RPDPSSRSPRRPPARVRSLSRPSTSAATAHRHPATMTWPDHPSVHEVFTWVWLDELSRRLGRPVTLADVPDEVWDAIVRPGFDAVWLMGVWERSPAGAAIARAHPAMQAAQREALPD